ncbi:aspartate dehydrogenase [Methylobacterium sp. PvP062]|uniref:L-aspartate dehydrogenase n=2 Tax=Methylobacteriaceae TaxID=119045 RepID=A0ABV2N921_9HYPH|nr:L-aspartate dehydrogenase [Methylobacterium radiotolerans]PVY88511.1 aspartate dehydrogenase [Methylobacterium organophilum]
MAGRPGFGERELSMLPEEVAKSPIRGGRVAIAGLGTVGRAVARALDRGAIPGLSLTTVAVRDAAKARAELAALDAPPEVVTAFDALEPSADIVLECAPSQHLPAIVRPFVTAGKTAVVLSCGALLEHEDLMETARAHGGQIVVPTGALLGLDAVTAAAEGTIHTVRMITRKPVRGLVGAPYLVENGIEIAGITEPMRVFSGSPREAARGFPANLNVAVALSLAGIGPDRTELEIWADPVLDRNTHRIEVEADSARFSMTIENVPTDENPRTGRITALSVIAYLRKLAAPLRVGT